MRWQLPALSVLGVALWVDALVGGDLAGNPACLALVVLVAVLAGWRSHLAELVLSSLMVAALLAVANQVASPGEFSFANDGVFYTVLVGGPAVTGWLLGTRTRQLVELRRRTGELERRRAGSVAAARAREAERVEGQVGLVLAGRFRDIIGEVHDATRLASADPTAVPARLAVVEATARDALTELRGVLGDLGEPAPELARARADTEDQQRTPGRRPLDSWDGLLLLSVLPLAVETAHAGHRGPVALNVVGCLGLGLALSLVRRRPLAGSVLLFTLAALQTAWLTPLPPTVGWMLPGLLVAFLAGTMLTRRTAPVGLVLAMLGLGAVVLATPYPQRALDATGPGAVMVVLAWWAGRSLAARDARATELRRVLGELAKIRDDEVRLAAFEQRAEMARELHDLGAHTLTVICLQAGAAQKLWTSAPARARTALATLEDLADDPLRRLGQSLGGLTGARPVHPLDKAALDVLAGLGAVLGIQVAIDVTGEPRELEEMVALVAFRVVQESLTNAARHAAHTSVRIDLAYTLDALDVSVSDSGPGPLEDLAVVAVNGSGSGSGLRGMRERVETCHGEFSCGPSGPGFAVHARLPTGAAL